MKILFISNFLPDTNYTRDLSVYFQKVCKEGDVLYLCGKKNEPVNDGRSPSVDEVWTRGIFFFVPLIRYVWKKKPDIVHLQQEFKTYGGIASAFLFPWFVLLIRFLGCKVVITSHTAVSKGQIDRSFLEGFGLKNSFVNRTLVKIFLIYSYKLIVRFSNRTTVHTNLLKSRLVEEYGCGAHKISVIPHGIREITDRDVLPKSPQIYKKFPILKKKKIILAFGYFSPRKGYELLLEALGKLFEDPGLKKDWIMVLAGDVVKEFLPYKKKIEKLIKQKKMSDSILITGYVDAKDVDELYRLAKVCVIPAVFSFNTSGVLSVALAYGRPLLVADVKPLGQEVKENNFGLLFDLHQPDSFRSELKKLISSGSFYEKTKQALRESASKRYWSRVAKKHYLLYKDVLSK